LKDWDKDIIGVLPESGTMGPIGITHVRKYFQIFIDAWKNY